MKVAIPVSSESNDISPRFGNSPEFVIVTTEGNNIVNRQVEKINTEEHHGRDRILKETNIDVLLCGGIGQGAINDVTASGIDISAGIQGNVDSTLQQYLSGQQVGTCQYSKNQPHWGSDGCHYL